MSYGHFSTFTKRIHRNGNEHRRSRRLQRPRRETSSITWLSLRHPPFSNVSCFFSSFLLRVCTAEQRVCGIFRSPYPFRVKTSALEGQTDCERRGRFICFYVTPHVDSTFLIQFAPGCLAHWDLDVDSRRFWRCYSVYWDQWQFWPRSNMSFSCIYIIRLYWRVLTA